MKLAIITVCTSRIDHALRCLESIDRQEGVDLDLYLVCNSIDDEYVCKLITFGMECKVWASMIRLAFSTEKIGLAYNVGLWYAKNSNAIYDRYAKIDDDIVLDADCLKTVVEIAADIIAIPPRGSGKYKPDVIREQFVYQYRALYGACNIYSRHAVNTLGFFDESCCRGIDTDWGIRAQIMGMDITYTDIDCLHLGDVPTEGIDAKPKKKVSELTFNDPYRGTIWKDPKVRETFISELIGVT